MDGVRHRPTSGPRRRGGHGWRCAGPGYWPVLGSRCSNPGPTTPSRALPRAGGVSSMSEKITWEVCPECGRTAAVGWLEGDVVEFDCVLGCRLSDVQLGGLERRLDLQARTRHPAFVQR